MSKPRFSFVSTIVNEHLNEAIQRFAGEHHAGNKSAAIEQLLADVLVSADKVMTEELAKKIREADQAESN